MKVIKIKESKYAKAFNKRKSQILYKPWEIEITTKDGGVMKKSDSNRRCLILCETNKKYFYLLYLGIIEI